MASQFCVRVGNNIKKYRKEAGIILKELGEKIGVTEATAQKYESGNIKKIDVEMLKKISDALGTTPEEHPLIPSATPNIKIKASFFFICFSLAFHIFL